MVPVPVGRVDSGSPADLLRAAKQELELILVDVNASQELTEWLWQSLLRCERVLFVVDNIENIAPAMPSSERELIVRRLFVSARQLRLPIFGTSKPDLLDSPAGSVFELPHLAADVIQCRLARAATLLDDTSLTIISEAVSGTLASPYMIERLVWLLRRAGELTITALRTAPMEARDLVLWRVLLAEQAVPGAVLTPTTLQLIAFHLITTGQLEIAGSNSDEWRRAATLASEVGIDFPSYEPAAVEIRSYVDGGFLDAESSQNLIRFASSDAQAEKLSKRSTGPFAEMSISSFCSPCAALNSRSGRRWRSHCSDVADRPFGWTASRSGSARRRRPPPPACSINWAWRSGSVARHDHGTTLSGFLPRAWDHLVASDGTTRRVAPWGLITSDIRSLHVVRRGGSSGVPGGFGD
jgi:hypothetical protein